MCHKPGIRNVMETHLTIICTSETFFLTFFILHQQLKNHEIIDAGSSRIQYSRVYLIIEQLTAINVTKLAERV